MKRQLFTAKMKLVTRTDNDPQFFSHMVKETCEAVSAHSRADSAEKFKLKCAY